MNIVTIDFDIIMAPIIDSYNDSIDEFTSVDQIMDKFPYMKSGKPDFYIYDYLNQFIYKICENKENINNIHFVSSHEEILDFIPEDEPEKKLINIDHHHDVGYDGTFWYRKLLKTNVDCGNWVKYLKDNQIINNYTWIYDYNSSMPEDTAKKYIDDMKELKDYNLLELAEETDILVICSSYDWVPMEYSGLFNCWENLIDVFKKWHKLT